MASLDHNSAELLARASRVRLAIFDVDGVLTDGGLYYDGQGEAIKRFNVHDGLGIVHLRRAGVKTAIISARSSDIVSKRAQDLGIDYVHQAALKKHLAFEQLLQQAGMQPEDCAFIGDDVIDLPVLTRVGFAVAVANARQEILPHVHWTTTASGGQGAVREFADLVLHAQGKFEAMLASYLP